MSSLALADTVLAAAEGVGMQDVTVSPARTAGGDRILVGGVLNSAYAVSIYMAEDEIAFLRSVGYALGDIAKVRMQERTRTWSGPSFYETPLGPLASDIASLFEEAGLPSVVVAPMTVGAANRLGLSGALLVDGTMAVGFNRKRALIQDVPLGRYGPSSIPYGHLYLSDALSTAAFLVVAERVAEWFATGRVTR